MHNRNNNNTIAVYIVLLLLNAQVLFAQTGTVLNMAAIYSNSGYLAEAVIGLPVASYYLNSNISSYIGATNLFISINPIEDTTCTIKGLVHAEDSLVTKGTIYLVDSVSKLRIDSASVQNGIFEIRRVIPGTYHILAQPIGNNVSYYSPTYYVSKRNIEESTPITVHDDISEIGSIDIYLLPSANSKTNYTAKVPLSVYPNPFTNHIFISLDSYATSKASYVIYDTRGTSLLQGEVTTVKGKTEYRLAINNLESGIYFLSLKLSNGEVLSRKLIKY